MHARDFRIDLKISVMRKSPASDFRITENVGLSRPCSHTVAVPPCAGIEGRGATLHFSVMRKSLASDVRSTEACRIAPSVFADGGGVPVRRHWREGGSLTMFGNARVACERRSIRVHACALARARVHDHPVRGTLHAIQSHRSSLQSIRTVLRIGSTGRQCGAKAISRQRQQRQWQESGQELECA